MAPYIPVWQHALDTVGQDLRSAQRSSVWKYWLPCSAQVMGLHDSDSEAREGRILNWLKLRDYWTIVLEENVTENKGQLGMLSLSEWQAYLDNGPSLSLTNFRPPEHVKALDHIWAAIGARYTDLDNSRPTWAGHEIVPSSVDARLCRDVAWELNELAFFIELRYIDDELSKLGKSRWRNTDEARQRFREGMFVKKSHRSFIPSIPNENMGLAAKYVREREQYLENFRRLLVAWPGSPSVLRTCGPLQDLTYASHVNYVEEVMTQFYVRSFYRRTGRAPILPRRSPVYSGAAIDVPYVPVPPPKTLPKISCPQSTGNKRKYKCELGIEHAGDGRAWRYRDYQ